MSKRGESSRLRLASRRAFTLFEMMIVVGLMVIIAGIALLGLGRLRTAGSSRGLATAVAAEMRLARDSAIASATPVAVVFPSKVSDSFFLLKGDSKPKVVRTVNYIGDFPQGAITVATYPGPTFHQGVSIPGAKSDAWLNDLNTWIPKRYKDDFVFVFTPNGSVVTNDLPSFSSAYHVSVATGAKVTPTGPVDPSGQNVVLGNPGVYCRLTSAGAPYTITISAGGAIQVTKGLVGYTGSSLNLQSSSRAALAQSPHPAGTTSPAAPTILNQNLVTPPPEAGTPPPPVYVSKGEYITLTVFAQSNDGLPLYTGWKIQQQTSSNPGPFSIAIAPPPPGKPDNLERMDFIPTSKVPASAKTSKYDPSKGGVWKSVWSWTPPSDAKPGDTYILHPDVTNAGNNVHAAVPPLPKIEIKPAGDLIFQRLVGSHWQLFTMRVNKQGNHRNPPRRVTTQTGRNYTCPSATSDGKWLCYERDGCQVWVGTIDAKTGYLDGTIHVAGSAANPARFPAISPGGSAVAYLVPAGGGNARVMIQQPYPGATPISVALSPLTKMTPINDPAAVISPANRLAFQHIGSGLDRLYYTAPPPPSPSSYPSTVDTCIGYADIHYTSSGITVAGTGKLVESNNLANDAQIGGLYVSRLGGVYYHADTGDPFVGEATTPYGPSPPSPPYRQSIGINEIFPAMSPKGDVLATCRDILGHYHVGVVTNNPWDQGSGWQQLTGGGDSLYPFWISEPSGN